ncbi:AAA family ATPase [Paenibacillus melissococcoides]|uniref:AAA family ATPase n=1 Tax=Paenibacillus melissococcoides TaxID=2912268 RepID=A0ABN8U0D4_9BACL|nr:MULTISPECIES: AAA family ATPase [Paenibacillus]MEB9892600.1 AAA family ATPase [Bacillus cereus]CAH8242955.1 AAA family ATPase [Paenibacillus melissococcoides]CAH8703466.1 AAA family ATPase [Paenibacillus melissococcoides]CAH8706360.1 AAA family ATPase [Paenibacillus melissococcoides]GIO80106.1 hypothetical protein J6TS7_37160 [Paenibacillus dendritiformis]
MSAITVRGLSKTFAYYRKQSGLRHSLRHLFRREELYRHAVDGIRMKMEIIAALIHRPQLLFLDEPTLGLDFAAQQNVRQFLRAYQEEKRATILLTSHYMRDIEQVCGRALVIHGGKIAYDGELARISASFGRRKRMKVRFAADIPPAELRALVQMLAEVRAHHGVTAELEVAADEVKPLARLLLDHDLVEDWTVEEIPVEEAIERLYAAKSEGEGVRADGYEAPRHATEG